MPLIHHLSAEIGPLRYFAKTASCAHAVRFPALWVLLLGWLSIVAATEVALIDHGGVYAVPVRINGVISLEFILDSGAAEVQIPADVALTLIRTRTITLDDFLPGATYTMADGSSTKSERFILRRLEIADISVENVIASIGSPAGELLLGQSLLNQIPKWSLDNQRHVLILGQPDPSLTSRSPFTNAESPQIAQSNRLQTRTWAPSFKCERAKTMQEQLICSSPELSRADVEMVKAYRRALAVAEDREAIKLRQIAWLEQHRNRCSDHACLAQAYSRRIAELGP